MPPRFGARPSEARRPRHAKVVVYRWDLDKTYLRTDFDSVRQLIRLPFQRPEDKVEVPGVVELIRALKPCAGQTGRRARIFFLSASPPQIGKTIRAKLALDDVPYDGIVFKNQLQHLVRGKFHNLREQVGFKLRELLRNRHGQPADAEEILFGDDWESDAVTYSIYADTLARRIDISALRRVLDRIRVDPKIAEEVLTLAQTVDPADAVRRIFVNLERRTPPVSFQRLGPRVVPTFNYLQTAAILCADGYIDRLSVSRVARSLAERAGYTPDRLVNSLADLCRRGHLAEGEEAAIRREFAREDLIPAIPQGGFVQRVRMRAEAGLRGIRWRRKTQVPKDPPSSVEPVDYDAVLGDLEESRRARRSQWRKRSSG